MITKEQEIAIFEEIFKNYYSKVRVFACGLIKDNSAAEEIVQNVFLQIWQNRTKLIKNEFLSYCIFNIIQDEISKVLRQNNFYDSCSYHELESMPEHEYKIGPELYLNEEIAENMQVSPWIAEKHRNLTL